MNFLDLEDPYILLYFVPLIFAVIYIAVSFFGERGE
jgi:hypothetical protein